MAIMYHEPGLTGVQLVNKLYAEPTTTYNHLKALKKHKLVISVQNGRAIKYYFNAKIARDFMDGFYHLMKNVPGSDKQCT